MNRSVVVALFLALVASTAAGDSLSLKNGKIIDGEVTKAAGGWDVKGADGKVTHFPSADVSAISLSGAPRLAGAGAADRLATLKRSAAAMSDPKLIVDRYKKFAADNRDAPKVVQDDARAELDAWQKKLDAGLVKAGGQWVTREAWAARQAAAIDAARDAMQLMKQNRLREAEPVIRKALEQDPNGASALYLLGVLSYRQEKLPDARKAFEQVDALVPDHAPTLNNLAVVLGRQNAPAAALARYAAAMAAAPGKKEILDNVAEALNGLAVRDQSGAAFARAKRLFDEQDQRLQATMQPTGWHRWGATWVDGGTLNQLAEAERALGGTLDAMAREFDRVKVRAENIENDLAEDRRLMRNYEVVAQTRAPAGLGINAPAAPLPSTYYNLQTEVARLERDRADAYERLDALRGEAKSAQQRLPVPKFSGVQRLIDVEGTPVVIPAANASPPAGPSPDTSPATPATRPTPG